MSALYKRYESSKAIATFPLCNFGGIEILDIEPGIEDKLIACFNFGTGRQQIRRHKICCSMSGRDYIRKQGKRYYLDEMI